MENQNKNQICWEHFSELHQGSSKREEFENLARSLFRKKFCKKDAVLHSNSNNPGIEVEPIYDIEGKNRISFQAKFFDNVVNYTLIKESVQKTIKYYYNKLDRLYLYSNKSINNNCESMKTVIKSLKDAKIELVLVTDKEILLDVICYPELCSCYFGKQEFNKKWIKQNLDIVIDTFGKKYNRKFNVETRSEELLNIFLLNDKAKEYFKKSLENYKESLLNVNEFIDEQDISVKEINNLLSKKIENEILSFEDIINFEDGIYEIFEKNIDRIRKEYNNLNDKLITYKIKDKEYYKLYDKKEYIKKIIDLSNNSIISDYEKNLINKNVLFIKGKNGVGKTQVVVNSAKKIYESGKNVLLINADMFSNNDYVEEQIVKNLINIDSKVVLEDILESFEEKARINNEKAYIIIDAINESQDLEIWKGGLDRLINKISIFKNIKLVITIRNGFENYIFSGNIKEKLKKNEIVQIDHRGLIDDSLEAVNEFLSYFDIKFSPEFYLNYDMINPLFLTWFCETYDGKVRSFFELIDRIIYKADEEASTYGKEKSPLRIIDKLLSDICEYEIKNNSIGKISKIDLLRFDIWQDYDVYDKKEYVKSLERFGILLRCANDTEEYYKFGYELIENYVFAKYVINNYKTKEQVKEFCRNKLLSKKNIFKYSNISKVAMISALYSIKYREECIEIINDIEEKYNKEVMLDQYYETFIWRDNVTVILLKTLLKEYCVNPEIVFKIFIENALKTENKLNSKGLYDFLKPYTISQRDCLWTLYINNISEDEKIIKLIYNYEKGKEIENINKEEAELFLLLCSWFLSSSNRMLRDRTSKAMIEILRLNIDLSVCLLEKFNDVNDPYICQRLYGIVFGAIMKRKEKSKNEYTKIVDFIYNKIFKAKEVYPDILLRDYARLIIERYFYEFPEMIDKYDKNTIIPPYNSQDIPIVKEKNYNSKKYKVKGIREILHSIQPDVRDFGVGMYGDFGRYVYQSALNDFDNVDIKNIYYYSMDYILNVLEYKDEYFGEYDTNWHYYDRHQTVKIERIGKKYQWIIMYRVLALLSDHNKIVHWSKNKSDYKGAWEPYVRDFDPTLNIRFDGDFYNIICDIKKYDQEGFIKFDVNEREAEQWVKNSNIMFDDFPNRFIIVDKNEKQWVSLCFYEENNIIPKTDNINVIYSPYGKQEIWLKGSSYIIKKEKNFNAVNIFKEKNVIRKYNCNPVDCYTLFNREYAWSIGYKEAFKYNREDDEEINGLNIVSNTSIKFLWEEQYDASQDEATSFIIPCGEIIQKMNLYQKEKDGWFYYKDELVAYDYGKKDGYHYNLLIRKDFLDIFLKENDYSIIWTLVGEKQYFLGERKQIWDRKEGYFIYDKIIKGCIKSVGMQ